MVGLVQAKSGLATFENEDSVIDETLAVKGDLPLRVVLAKPGVHFTGDRADSRLGGCITHDRQNAILGIARHAGLLSLWVELLTTWLNLAFFLPYVKRL